MEIKVHFRFNKITGEIELFEVDDEGPMRLSEAEHNRLHDRIAAEVGNVVERNPRVDEILPGAAELEAKVDTEEAHHAEESRMKVANIGKDKQSKTP